MIVSEMSRQIDKNILDNLKNVKCFPTFMSNKIYLPKQKKIFILGDAFYAFPPTFAQGASQSIEAAYDLYEMFENKRYNPKYAMEWFWTPKKIKNIINLLKNVVR